MHKIRCSCVHLPSRKSITFKLLKVVLFAHNSIEFAKKEFRNSK